jgi:hypothetical protein
MRAVDDGAEVGSKPAKHRQLNEARSTFAPDLQPLITWLVTSKTLSSEELAHILRSDLQPVDIIEIVYDALKPSVRASARKLALQRPELHVNGAIGPFSYQSGDVPSVNAISRGDVEVLRSIGFLQQGALKDSVVMPNQVRHFLARREYLHNSSAAENVHRWMSSLPDDSAQGRIEKHHHAICSHDVETAISTADYYGADLRDLALKLSLEGAYVAAADIYRTIVEKFDSEDAYAWQYLGYNLAKSPLLSEDGVFEAKKAYSMSVRLAPQNPLYVGRWLGFRGRTGENIEAEIEAYIPRFRADWGQDVDSYFGEAVIKGLQAGRQNAVVQRLKRRWPELVSRARGV